MINPLQVASDGYLAASHRVLLIAVNGYLIFGVVPPTPPSPGPAPLKVDQGGGGHHRYSRHPTLREQEQRESEDVELMILINTFLSCL